ncbi:class II aaRS and biotin synthetase [Ascobolus immersus RN42]|uniref:Class II aaRS and biotin synthetase n=1 Tax=Ascobolus immersus RN42 TaxID=1160509 RepID=A0A3N4HLY2_ASCIM|nr:class II aaRS and biotin synthetase [Ascobolus immersus RN42]
MRPRLPANALVMQIRSQVLSSINNFFVSREFVQTQPPIITSSDCEGAGEVFKLAPQGREHHFKTEKYLTVSTQLHLEALCQAVGKVWTLSPSFRAEKSDTNRHLSEFYMLEAEVGFTQSLEDVLSLCEDLIRSIAHDFRQSRFSDEWLSTKEDIELRLLESRWKWLLNPTQWKRMSYTEAISLLQKADVPFRFKPEWGHGLQAEHERYLAENFGGTGDNSTTTAGPIFITDYPKTLKPFYMLENQGSSSASSAHGKGSETVACFDLLFPGLGEVAGGSLREHRFREIVEAMKQHGLVAQDATDDSLGSMQWYADLRRWGTIEHGGFGIGFDRLLSWLIGIENVREVVTFPRWHGKCEC